MAAAPPDRDWAVVAPAAPLFGGAVPDAGRSSGRACGREPERGAARTSRTRVAADASPGPPVLAAPGDS